MITRENKMNDLPWPNLRNILDEKLSDYVSDKDEAYLFNDWGLYFESYRRAAKIIQISMQENDDNKILLCPYIYVKRHAIELILKIIIFLGNYIRFQIKKRETGHKLTSLWYSALEQIKHIWSQNINIKDIDAIGKLIELIEKNDKDSQRFRYPIDIKGKTPQNIGFHISNIIISTDQVLECLKSFAELLYGNYTRVPGAEKNILHEL